MRVTPIIILASALGVTALPGHAHLHREAHEKRGQHFKGMRKTITKTVTPTTTAQAVTTPVAVVAAAVATSTSQTTSSSSSASSSSSGTYKEFCGGVSARNLVERTTLADIAYVGNTGTSSNWGCNMMTVASNIASSYNYTASFKNVASETYSVTCFNKIGPTGLIDGFFHSAVSFTVAPGSSQDVAFEADSQGGCAFSPGSSTETTSLGQFAGTWVEFDMGSSINKGWSGADCSSLVAQKYGLTVPGCRACNSAGTCSTIWPGGKGDNAYIAGTEDESGIGINQPAGAWVLAVEMGYSS